jgi:hypothetical protein
MTVHQKALYWQLWQTWPMKCFAANFKFWIQQKCCSLAEIISGPNWNCFVSQSNCLFKIKSHYCGSIGIVFKVRNQNWLLFGQFLLHFNDFMKSEPNYCSSNGNNLCASLNSRTKLSRVDDPAQVIVSGRLYFHCFLNDCTVHHQKALLQRPRQIWPRPGV